MSRVHSRAEERHEREQVRSRLPPGRGLPLPGLNGAPSEAVSQAALLDVQQSAGNRAAAILVSRQPTKAPSKAPPTPAPKAPASAPGVVATITLSRGGTIAGSSKVPGHEGKLELESVNQVANRGGATSRREPDEFVELVLVRRPDAASAEFMKASLDGDPVSAAKFEFLRSTPDGGIEVVHVIELTDGMISNYTRSGDLEEITIQFRRPKAGKEGGANS